MIGCVVDVAKVLSRRLTFTRISNLNELTNVGEINKAPFSVGTIRAGKEIGCDGRQRFCLRFNGPQIVALWKCAS